MTLKSFGNNFGFIMKSKINSLDETCFSLPTGYSINIHISVSIPFGEINYTNSYTGNYYWG